MNTIALRLYGADDIRLETFTLPEVGADEVLMRVVSDTVCASTYKAVKLGTGHKRVPKNVAENPIIIGHEMCGEVISVGKNVADRWKAGDRVVIQPALKLENGYDPGYSYATIGGNATYCVVPSVVLERDCMVPFEGEGYYKGSLVESLGCCLRGFKGMYHTDPETYVRTDGIRKGGKVAILGGAGPMGLGCVELALGYGGASQVVVTDISASRLEEAKRVLPPEKAAAKGASLTYVDTSDKEDAVAFLREISNGGFDDVLVMVPVAGLLAMAEAICCEDGCINYFAGSADHGLMGSINLYRVHYDGIHMLGTAGSIPADTREIIHMMADGVIDPSAMISHICGLSAAKESVYGMAKSEGLKKVCYSHIDLPLVAIKDFAKLGETDPLFRALAEITERHGGLWSVEAENYLLAHAPKMQEGEIIA